MLKGWQRRFTLLFPFLIHEYYYRKTQQLSEVIALLRQVFHAPGRWKNPYITTSNCSFK